MAINPPVKGVPYSAPGALDPTALAQKAAEENRDPGDDEDLWPKLDIDPIRWDRHYPYQLLVLQVESSSGGQSTYHVDPERVYTFPLPPEALSYNIPLAARVRPTLGGVAEQHNGTPLRDIILKGSTGLVPGRTGGLPPGTPSPLESVAGGTIQAARNLAAAGQAVWQDISGGSPRNGNLLERTQFASDAQAQARGTGYYQYHLLQRFLEAYAATRKTRAGRNLRLALARWKDNQVELIGKFTLAEQKDANSPLEYAYTLTLQVYRRVDLGASTAEPLGLGSVRRQPGKLAQILNTIRDSRIVLQGVNKVAAAALGDLDRLILEPAREASLLIKDALGAAITLHDLPNSLYQRVLLDKAKVGELAFDPRTSTDPLSAQVSQVVTQMNKDLAAVGTTSKTRLQAASRGEPANAAIAQSTSLARRAKEAPKSLFQALEGIPASGKGVTVEAQAAIRKEIARVKALQRSDWESRRDDVRNAADRLATAFGAGHPVFSDLYGINQTVVKSQPTATDWAAIAAIHQLAQALDSLAATSGDPPPLTGYVEAVAATVRRAGIAFRSPRSKFAVPFPYGSTLPDLARTYLGDPDRWYEIAALNGLRTPFVDEEGYDTALLINGVGNQISVPSTTELAIGQVVSVVSTRVARTLRHVVGLRTVGNTIVVSLDGAADLGSFKTADQATLHAYKVDTVNSQQLIWIPSDRPAPTQEVVTRDVPGVPPFDPYLAAGGIDLLIGSDNDLVLTPDGEGRYVLGLANVIQQLRIDLQLTQGDLPRHPEVGLPFRVGDASSETDARSALAAVRKMLARDKTFARVDSAQVIRTANSVRLNIAAIVQGSQENIQVGFDLRR